MSFFFSDIGSCNKLATNRFNALAFISRTLSGSFQGPGDDSESHSLPDTALKIPCLTHYSLGPAHRNATRMSALRRLSN